jgi:transcriptional regulator with XRE-family HTH domain
MDKPETFQTYLKAKRNARGVTVRAMAEMAGVAVGYYCDIESGRRTPLDLGLLDRIVAALHLPDGDRETLYDLAGRARSTAPPDLPEYINNNPAVRAALRVARERASEDDWRRFIDDLERKG